MNPHAIEHNVVSAATRSSVYHYLHAHPWVYPLVVVAVLLLWLHGRRRRRPVPKTSSGPVRPENVSVLAKPTNSGKGHWQWVQDDSQRTSGG
jgi:hypothetical protein